MNESFGPWHVRENLSRSPRFQRDVERWLAEDLRERRATNRFSEYPTVEDMRAEVRTLLDADERQNGRRPRAWSKEACESNGIWTEPQSPLAALEAHIAGAYRIAAEYCGASWLADAAIGFMRGQGDLPVLGAQASSAVLFGKGASSTVAGFVEDPAWSKETTRRARNRAFAPGRTADDGTVYMIDQAEFARLCAQAARPKP